jgi:mRNA interferase YafQ
LSLLLADEQLPERCRPHKLIGNYLGFWECHIEPDWLLIYDVTPEFLELAAMGSHADLFK